MDAGMCVRPRLDVGGHGVTLCVRLKADRSIDLDYDSDDWIRPGMPHRAVDPIALDLMALEPSEDPALALGRMLARLQNELRIMWACGTIYECPVTGRLGIRNRPPYEA